ncbi:hypothetical protein KW805_04885 [Candidatus Pacearchaeota archaeon]|nr:hypothetical protein [Candidatus Pacearchaeota archaeon]
MKGAAIVIILVLSLSIVSSFVFFLSTSHKQQEYSPGDSRAKKDCSGNGTVDLISPMNLEDIGIIIPMGAVIGGHVTPIDHMYFQPVVFNSRPDTYDVYADADGVIDGIGSEPLGNGNRYPKYRLTILHTCDFYSIYNLLTSLSPQLSNITGPIDPGSYYFKPIAVKKGDLLGKIGGQTLDLSVNYDKSVLKGFIVPEHYEAESWKIHTVDPFDYFIEPIRTQLLGKNVRQAEPRGGKIDYDVDGRLVGNWFIEGTGGYAGGAKDPQGYWKTHAAFVYDHIDPTHIIVSLGNYSDIAERFTGENPNSIHLQYGVKGNSPDPKNVGVSTGLTKYELVDTAYVLSDSGQMWNRMSYANNIRAVSGNYTHGVVLVQLISERKMKLEIFPGKNSSEVLGFVNPTVYER